MELLEFLRAVLLLDENQKSWKERAMTAAHRVVLANGVFDLLHRDGLRRSGVVLSDGLHVNGSDLARAFVDGLPPSVAVTGPAPDRQGRTSPRPHGRWRAPAAATGR